MMKYVTKYLCLALAAGLCCGCRSGRSVMVERVGVRHDGHVAVESVDTVATRAVTAAESEKTGHVAADESGRVEICRDSVGRPVAFVWWRSLDIAADERVRGLLDHCLDGVKVSGISAVTGSSDTVAQRHEDKKTEITTPRIEGWISSVCLAGVVLCLTYIFFVDYFLPWIKTRHSR